MEIARHLDELGQTHAALDMLLRSVRVDDVSVDLLLGILTVTLAAKTNLSGRRAFFRAVQRSLHARGANTEGLLVGLE